MEGGREKELHWPTSHILVYHPQLDRRTTLIHRFSYTILADRENEATAVATTDSANKALVYGGGRRTRTEPLAAQRDGAV